MKYILYQWRYAITGKGEKEEKIFLSSQHSSLQQPLWTFHGLPFGHEWVCVVCVHVCTCLHVWVFTWVSASVCVYRSLSRHLGLCLQRSEAELSAARTPWAKSDPTKLDLVHRAVSGKNIQEFGKVKDASQIPGGRVFYKVKTGGEFKVYY